MRRFLIMLLFVCFSGCANDDILKKNVKEMDAPERAKYITTLWRKCQEGVLKSKEITRENIGTPNVNEIFKKRIKILEEVYPYGKKSVEIARYDAYQPIFWFSRCVTALAYYYELLGDSEIDQGENDEGLKQHGKLLREKAKDSARIGIQLLRDYEKYHYPRHSDPQLYPMLEANYEMIGDNKSAYLVAKKWLGKLKSEREKGNDQPALLQAIDSWEAILKKLRDKLINNLETVPK